MSSSPAASHCAVWDNPIRLERISLTVGPLAVAVYNQASNGKPKRVARVN
jgi:hypothetical protein